MRHFSQNGNALRRELLYENADVRIAQVSAIAKTALNFGLSCFGREPCNVDPTDQGDGDFASPLIRNVFPNSGAPKTLMSTRSPGPR